MLPVRKGNLSRAVANSENCPVNPSAQDGFTGQSQLVEKIPVLFAIGEKLLRILCCAP